jgi:hypothetical protein
MRKSAYSGRKGGWSLRGVDWITPMIFVFLLVKLLAFFKR